MVVFNQHTIVEPHSMIGSASASHCVFLKEPITGKRLAGVEDHRSCAMNAFYELSRA